MASIRRHAATSWSSSVKSSGGRRGGGSELFDGSLIGEIGRRKLGGGFMPRHCRSGWHLMCPKRAFHDQNFLPHSLHGLVIFGAVGSGFLPYLGFEMPIGEVAAVSNRMSLERFRRGFSWRFAGVEEEAKKSPMAVGVVDTVSLCGGEMGNWRWKSESLIIEKVWGVFVWQERK